jgi:branched-chain amino acid transport system ATP-binding protein
MDILENNKLVSADGILSVENIYASYYKKEILRGVSISVSNGEIVTLIGPNGAGKSTLLKVIIGTLAPQEGSVYFLNEDVTNFAPHLRVKKGIGYFMQGGEVFRNLMVLENLELAGFDLPKPEYKERLNEVFGLFPILAGIKLRRAGLLSGGERQALAFGIVLMRRPKLLLLDEPSAGLAPSLVKQIIAKIRRINTDLGISILLVEQNIGEALKISERVYILKNGEIVGEEKPKNLAQKETLEDVFFS